MLLWIEGNHKLHMTVGYQTGSWSSAATRETHNLACELHSEGRSTYRQERFGSLWVQQAVHPWAFPSARCVPGSYLPSGASHPARHRWLRPGHTELWCSRVQPKVKANPASWERESSCTCCDVWVLKVIAKRQEKSAQPHLCSPEGRCGKTKQLSLDWAKDTNGLISSSSGKCSACQGHTDEKNWNFVCCHLANARTVHSANRKSLKSNTVNASCP